MMPRCVVTDLDRTLTGPDLVLDGAALGRIRDLRADGIRVVVATGRRLGELEAMGLAAEVDAFVAENGAIVAAPAHAAPEVVDPAFATSASRALGLLRSRFHWGQVVGSGPRHLAEEASGRLRRAGVAHALEFNAEEVMVLPEGVDKATGAARCLAKLGLTAAEAWAIGDGENDVALLRWAQVGAAPANAAPQARQAARVLLAASHAQAFVDLTEPLLRRERDGLSARAEGF